MGVTEALENSKAFHGGCEIAVMSCGARDERIRFVNFVTNQLAEVLPS
jgi:hypothetical protein